MGVRYVLPDFRPGYLMIANIGIQRTNGRMNRLTTWVVNGRKNSKRVRGRDVMVSGVLHLQGGWAARL
jgi:hypothetical protein